MDYVGIFTQKTAWGDGDAAFHTSTEMLVSPQESTSLLEQLSKSSKTFGVSLAHIQTKVR
jgi:hypothetical protein